MMPYEKVKYELGLAKRSLPTRARTILMLEIRGHSKKEIARMIGMSPLRVGLITRTDRYIQHRDAELRGLDNDFLAMKPSVMAALDNALRSRDEKLALAASETWFRTSGYMQYGKGVGQTGVTAEDVARELVQVNVQVNVGDQRAEPAGPASSTVDD
jgi:hypothetical protein